MGDLAILITGAARGIGRALAEHYTRAGWLVTGMDREAPGPDAAFHFVQADVRQRAQVQDAVARHLERFRRLDALVNNAGIGGFKPFLELTDEDWDQVLDTNLKGSFVCAQEAAQAMRENAEGGAIVQIASTRALMSEPDSEAYAASKGGMVALAHALAVSLAPYRIRVNCISPGWINSAGEDLREIDHRQHPAGRVGKPEDIARACAYLTDPANDFVTGANLVVDGGMTRKMIYEE